MKKFKSERIEWMDHTGQAGWLSIEHLEKDLPVAMITSIGFVVKENKDFLYLASDIHAEVNNCASVTCIVKGAIVKRKVIKI